MVTPEELRRLALALEGVTEAPHFDRTAFKVARIFATVPRDGETANLKLSPAEQAFKMMMVPNAWGAQGWTSVTLASVDEEELRRTLEMAWKHAVAKRPKGQR